MEDIAQVVRMSSDKGVNVPQLVGDDDGNIIVKTYEWLEMMMGTLL